MSASSPRPVRYLTRAEFAHAVGISERQLQRLEAIGSWTPSVPNPGGGKGHRTLYAIEQVEQFKKARRGLALPEPSIYRVFTAAEAKAGFEQLRLGSSVEDMVMCLEMHPDTACAIRDRWQQVRAEANHGIFVSPATIAAIEELPVSNPRPKNEAELLAILREAAGENVCRACKERSPHICEPCSTAREAKARKEGLVAVKKANQVAGAAVALVKKRRMETTRRRVPTLAEQQAAVAGVKIDD